MKVGSNSSNNHNNNELSVNNNQHQVAKTRSATPPVQSNGNQRSFRSARTLRHQASLKTSSILAKLVSGASKGASHLRKSNARERDSDLEDNDTDTDSGNISRSRRRVDSKQDDATSIESNILGLSVPNALGKHSTTVTQHQPEVISPLSSVSSLNSTNSSMTVNSVCASLPNRRSCSILHLNWSSSTCCNFPVSTRQPKPVKSINEIRDYYTSAAATTFDNGCGLRNRSATVPNRAQCFHLTEPQEQSIMPSSFNAALRSSTGLYEPSNTHVDSNQCNVSEILQDKLESSPASTGQCCGTPNIEPTPKQESSLWLGCDDGTLLIIDCLSSNDTSTECESCGTARKNSSCPNVHLEIKLDAQICDMKTYGSGYVFVALANGQLAVFSRSECSASFTTPKLLDVAPSEFGSSSRLCLLDDNRQLWYSYARSIYVLNADSLLLENVITAPNQDTMKQISTHNMNIDQIEPITTLPGVCVSFKNSYLVQLYDTRNYKLVAGLNLLEPLNKVLAFGNEIIRHHKTTCLTTTSMLSVPKIQEDCTMLFLGTSAGIILYLVIPRKEFAQMSEATGPGNSDLSSQLVCLRHGHSGQVKFMHQIELEDEASAMGPEIGGSTSELEGRHRGDTFLISGGAGLDMHGPIDEQQQQSAMQSRLGCTDEDCINHLVLWQL